MNSLPATEKRLAEIRMKQDQDEVCAKIKQYCDSEWAQSKFIQGAVKPYLPVALQLSVVDGLLMRGSRIVIPVSMRLDILDCLHSPRYKQVPGPCRTVCGGLRCPRS